MLSYLAFKKNGRSEAKNNFSVINEIHRVISAETFNVIKQQSMTVINQYSACSKLYHSGMEIMGQAEK